MERVLNDLVLCVLCHRVEVSSCYMGVLAVVMEAFDLYMMSSNLKTLNVQLQIFVFLSQQSFLCTAVCRAWNRRSCEYSFFFF